MNSTPAALPLAGRLLAPAITLLAAALPASADVTIAAWQDAVHYDYHVNWMPDLDQRRVGLLNQGSMHCVPTSTMNMLAYAAQWGFESMDPGPGTWTGYDDYYDMTAHIDELGELMDTDDGGTNGSGKQAGLDAWIAGQPLVADYVWRSGTNCPTLSDVVQALEGGHIGSIAYGRYEWAWGFQGAMRLIDRTGGHAVTVMHAASDGFFDETLWTRDPADDNPVDVFGQSPFAYQIYDSVQTTDSLQLDTDDDGTWEYFEGTMLNFDAGSDRIRLIDSYTVLRPISGYSYNHVSVAFEGLGGGDWISSGPPAQPFEFSGTGVISVAPQIGFNDLLVLGQLGPDTTVLTPFNRFRGAADDRVVLPFLAHATSVDPNGFAFVAGSTRVERRSNADLQEITHAFTRSEPISAMAGDDGRRVLWLFSDAGRHLTMLKSASLEVVADFIATPTWFPTTPIRDLTVCPESGTLWMLFEGFDKAFGLVVGDDGSTTGTTAGDAALIDPVSVTCDDRGHLIVSDGQQLHAFRDTSAGFQRYDDPWYADAEVRGKFHVDRSRSNYDPAEHDTPGWNRNIPAEDLEPGTSVRDCPADFDGDGAVGLGDILGVLATWGTDDPQYDIVPLGGNGSVDLDELLLVLAAWGPCR